MDYSLGTLNVKTLNGPGALKALIQQLDKYNGCSGKRCETTNGTEELEKDSYG